MVFKVYEESSDLELFAWHICGSQSCIEDLRLGYFSRGRLDDQPLF